MPTQTSTRRRTAGYRVTWTRTDGTAGATIGRLSEAEARAEVRELKSRGDVFQVMYSRAAR